MKPLDTVIIMLLAIVGALFGMVWGLDLLHVLWQNNEA